MIFSAEIWNLFQWMIMLYWIPWFHIKKPETLQKIMNESYGLLDINHRLRLMTRNGKSGILWILVALNEFSTKLIMIQWLVSTETERYGTSNKTEIMICFTLSSMVKNENCQGNEETKKNAGQANSVERIDEFSYDSIIITLTLISINP